MRAACNEFARRRPIDPELWSAFARNIFYQQGELRRSRPPSRRSSSGSTRSNGRWACPATASSIWRRRRPRSRRSSAASARPSWRRKPPPADAPKPLGAPPPFARVIIEKPFGTDLETARALNRDIHETLDERQIYRIDHYLGKETVQNLLVFRFANGIFEPVWNNRFVDHVQITGAETIGVEARGGYFEQAGSLRDMVQNHLLQVLSLFAMEPPVAFDPDAVRDEKLKVLKALRYIPASDFEQYVVRAQYAAGSSGGQAVRGYREEPNVSPTSTTETFVALKLFIDSWRWAGVPFYLRSGKRLPKRVTEIAVHFKEAPHLLFGRRGESIRPNVLGDPHPARRGDRAQLRIEAARARDGDRARQHGVPLRVVVRRRAARGLRAAAARLPAGRQHAVHARRRGRGELGLGVAHPPPLGRGRRRQRTGAALPTYPAGIWGPPAAERLMAADGRAWRLP